MSPSEIQPQCPFHGPSEVPQPVPEQLRSDELPFEHLINLSCIFSNGRKVIVPISINNQESDIGATIHALNSILITISIKDHGATLSLTPTDLMITQNRTPNTIDNILNKWHPEERVARLSEPSKELNRKVNDHCDLITDEVILSIATTLPERPVGDWERTLWVTTLMGEAFNLAFEGARNGIRTNMKPGSKAGEVISGVLTYTKTPSELLTENEDLVPSAMAGLIRKIYQTTGWRHQRVIAQLAKLDEQKLNQVIWGLRIGKNGAVGNDYLIDACFFITHLFGRIRQIGLDPEILQKKADDIVNVNKQNRQLIEMFKQLSAKADLNNMQILFNEERFGLLYGSQAPCPVTYADKSGGKAYLPQVRLALRVLRIADNFEKQHRPNLQTRFRSALMHQAGKLLNRAR